MKKVGVLVIVFLLLFIPISSAKTLHPISKETIKIEQVTTEEVDTEPEGKRSVASDTYYYYGTGLIAKEEDNQLEYVHKDNLGSTRVVTDLNGNTIESNTYLPYGENLDSSRETFTFTGKELDSSGLQYFGARYYDPSLGRFISVDPIGDGGNWYEYAASNPLKFVDPTGMVGENVVNPQVYYNAVTTSWKWFHMYTQATVEVSSHLGYYHSEPLTLMVRGGMRSFASAFTELRAIHTADITLIPQAMKGGLNRMEVRPNMFRSSLAYSNGRMLISQMGSWAHELGHFAHRFVDPSAHRTSAYVGEKYAELRAANVNFMRGKPFTSSQTSAIRGGISWMRNVNTQWGLNYVNKFGTIPKESLSFVGRRARDLFFIKQAAKGYVSSVAPAVKVTSGTGAVFLGLLYLSARELGGSPEAVAHQEGQNAGIAEHYNVQN